MKITDNVSCQTSCPFGINCESFKNPKYLDKLAETGVAEPVESYDQKATCCGGALAFSEPDKSQMQIKKIIESAYDHGSEMIVIPCPVCQINVKVHQDQINKKYNTRLNIPVMYFSQLITVAYGGSLKEDGLNGNIVRPKKHVGIAAKQATLHIK